MSPLETFLLIVAVAGIINVILTTLTVTDHSRYLKDIRRDKVDRGYLTVLEVSHRAERQRLDALLRHLKLDVKFNTSQVVEITTKKKKEK